MDTRRDAAPGGAGGRRDRVGPAGAEPHGGAGPVRPGLEAVLDAGQDPDNLYRRVWLHLAGLGLVADRPERARADMADAIRAGRAV